MAIGVLRAGNVGLGMSAFVPVSAGAAWVTAHDNAAATAWTAAELLRPATHAGASFHWVRRGNATRVLLRARIDSGVSAIATSPVVRIYGAFDNGAAGAGGEGLIGADGAAPDTGTVRFLRLDSINTDDAGITLTLVLAATATRFRDASYVYTSPHSITGTDLLGCDYFGVAVSTAASVTGGTTIPIEAMLIN